MQIALDSARGLEYIHEHTVPVYIHRDIKSANILIDNNYHAKVILVHVFHYGPFEAYSYCCTEISSSSVAGCRFWID